MSSGGTLPLEILIDILSRLPVKSLCRFNCVSHLWRSQISDPHFAKTHLNQTKTTNPQYLDQKILLRSTSSHNFYSVDFANINPTATKLVFPTAAKYAAHNSVQVLSSYDGLLLVSQYGHSYFSLFNPSTRECKKFRAWPFVLNPVPLHGVCRYVYGVGYNSSTDDYNVVILSFYRTESSTMIDITVADVYSLNANAWRRIEGAGYVLVGASWGVFFNGCLHCLCWRNGSCVILAFNLLEEIFREVPPPASLRGCKMGGYCVELVRGCLGLVGRRTTYQTDVWMMEEYGVVESWSKFTIELPTERPRSLLCWLPEDNFLFDNSRSTDGENLVVYNPKKETLRDMVVAGIPSEYTFCGTYVESLISPNLGGGIGRLW